MTSLRDDWVEAIPGLDTLTIFYGSGGNALVTIGDFAPTQFGVVLMEQSNTGGSRWGPIHGHKLSRGILTNCTATAGQFRVQLEGEGVAGFRVRCQQTIEMEKIRVQITFAGRTFVHMLRTEPNFVIAEAPDERDLTH